MSLAKKYLSKSDKNDKIYRKVTDFGNRNSFNWQFYFYKNDQTDSLVALALLNQ